MNNKILVKVLIPEIDETFDCMIPYNVRIGTVIKLLNDTLSEVSGGSYIKKINPSLFNVFDASAYDVNMLVRETNIRNGSQLIMM